jgi:hypothetical protein
MGWGPLRRTSRSMSRIGHVRSTAASCSPAPSRSAMAPAPQMVGGPPDARQRIPVRSRYHLTRRSLESNGRAPEVGRRGPTAIGVWRRLPRCRIRQPPSRPAHSPSRRLLGLVLQQQLDALSDERRGVPVLRVRDQLSHPVPRRLIQAEGDDSRLSCHSLSSFPCGRDRRLKPLRPSAVSFMENRNDAPSQASSRRTSAIGAKRTCRGRRRRINPTRVTHSGNRSQ